MAIREILAGKAVVEIGLRNKIEAGLKSIQGRLRRFSSGISTLGGSLAGVGGATTAIFSGLGASLAFPTQLAAGLEKTTAQFETMLGSASKAQAMLGELKAFAASTPLQFQDIADAAQKLLAFGVAAGDVPDELRRVGDVASAIGAPLGEIAEIYGKAKTQGRLFMEDINQLTGRGIPIIQELAKQFGVAESDIKDLVASGAVNFGNLQKAFIDLTSGSGKFAGMMAKQAETLAGRWSTLKDNMIDALIPIGQAVSDMLKPLLSAATRLVAPIAIFIKQNASAARIVALVAAAGTAAGTALLVLGGALMAVGSVASFAASAVGFLGTILAAVSGPVLAIVAAVGLLGGAIAYAAYQTNVMAMVAHFIGNAFRGLLVTVQETMGGVLKAMAAGRFRLAANILWSGIKLGFLQGSQGVLKVFELFWNNANSFQMLILTQMLKNAYNVLRRLPEVALSALGSGKPISEIIASAVMGVGKLELSGMLDKPIADAQKQLDNLNRRASNLQRGPNGPPQPQRGPQPFQQRGPNGPPQPQRGPQPFQQRGPEIARLQRDFEQAQAELEAALAAKPDGKLNELAAASVGGEEKTRKLASSGTFSATAAALFGLNSDNQPAKDTAQHTKQMVGLLKRLAKQRADQAFT